MMSEKIEVDVASRRRKLSGELKDLFQRARTWSKYPQGFMTCYRSNIIDNLDGSHSLKQIIVIPEETVAIYKADLHVFGKKYRAYESQLAGGGGDLLTSEATIPDSVTSGSPSNTNTGFTTPDATTSSQWTGNTGAPSSSHTHSLPVYQYGYYGKDLTHLGGILYTLGGDDYINLSEGGSHYHSFGSGHTHTNQPALHCHFMEHTHLAPGSLHSHLVNVPDSVHDTVAGIYEPAAAEAEVSLTLKDPDGVETDFGSLGSGEFETELELQDYMMKKGVYTLTFTADGVARVSSILFCTVFLESD